jgi:LuxR family transcriptional regulator, maltose regulon positive regulatory protein
MSDDLLLLTKLQIPAARPGLVRRSRLLARLDEGLRLGRRLTLVCAPPGFGKTTLLRDWADACRRRVVWLSVDEGDNDPATFVRYLLAGLGQVDERVAARCLGLQGTPQAQLVALINALAAAAGEVLLVLDDYHLLRAFVVHDLVAFLLANPPAGLHVAIGTREDPPLPLARLRARDQLSEVREGGLRFTTDEAGAFLSQTMGLQLSGGAVASLSVRTEGWVTGLQLAGVALRQQSSAEEFVAAFAGDDRYVVDYLVAEVLEREAEPVRTFLHQTAILGRLCAALCDAVTGREDGAQVLEHLEAANLFLVPLDNRREWYRYHVLFAEVLRLALGGEEQIELHRRAAAWYEAHGLGELAMSHTRQVAELLSAGSASRLRADNQPLVEPLSERELEVLRLIAAGYSNGEIAGKLYIAGGTVKRHINNIFGKLGVTTRTQAVATARAIGLVD